MTELLQSLSTQNEFVARHNGPNKSDQQKMLEDQVAMTSGLCLPEKEFTTTGSNGKQDRQNIFKRHRAVIASSRLTTTFRVKNLELELDLSHI